MDKQLLEILVCPTTGQPLARAETEDIEAVNAAIDSGSADHVDHTPVEAPVEALLVTRDHRTAYRVDDGIPVLLPECGIRMPSRGA